MTLRGSTLPAFAGSSASAVRAPRAAGLLMLALALGLQPAACPAAVRAAARDAVLRATLDNGLTVVIVRDPLAPVVTTIVNYRVGSDEAPPGFPGTAHAQEHMMFRGSPGLSADQLAKITALMGGMFDADTQQTVTQYFYTVPASDLDIALRIESIRMHGVLDSEPLWDAERGAIEQEVARDLSEPEYVAYTRLLAAVFEHTPYAHDALGTRPSFDRTTGAMLQAFHDAWYAPNNAVLIVAGDTDPHAALAEIRTLFGDIPAKTLPPRPPIHLGAVQPVTVKLDTDQAYGQVLVAFRLPGYDSPDYAAAQVLADILNSQRSDLYALVPAGKALATGFSVTTLPQAGMGYAQAAFGKGSDATALEQDIRNVLARHAAKGFHADLVEAAKLHEIANAEFRKNSTLQLAMGWSQALAVEGRSSPDDDVRAIKRVTVADVDRVARQYLDPAQAVVAILTPRASGLGRTGQGFGRTESLALKQTQPVVLPAWARETLDRLSVPVSTVRPVVSVLPNGLKLIVQPESASNTVSVYGHIDNDPDLETPTGQEGVSDALAQLFSYGTTSLDRIAFQKALDDIGASESAGTDFTLAVLADGFDRGMQLLADNELRPALPDAAFETTRRQLVATVAGRLQSPQYLAERALMSALFPPQDPTQRQATPATVSALTLEDVKRYYARVFRPDLTTMVVIGRISPETAKAVVQRYFGGWKANGDRPNTLLPPVPPSRASTVFIPDASRVQDNVTLAETVDLTRSNPDYYPLELGNHVLGGAFYATRLYRDLREQSGLVYQVASAFDAGRTRTLYSVTYACDPANVATARAVVLRNLRAMQNHPVGADELRQAKQLLLSDIPLSESSVDAIAEGLIRRSRKHLPLDEPRRAAHRYVALTAPQVQAAFRRRLRPEALIQITLGPEGR